MAVALETASTEVSVGAKESVTAPVTIVRPSRLFPDNGVVVGVWKYVFPLPSRRLYFLNRHLRPTYREIIRPETYP